jgi:hypothetical protein
LLDEVDEIRAGIVDALNDVDLGGLNLRPWAWGVPRFAQSYLRGFQDCLKTLPGPCAMDHAKEFIEL